MEIFHSYVKLPEGKFLVILVPLKNDNLPEGLSVNPGANSWANPGPDFPGSSMGIQPYRNSKWFLRANLNHS